MIQIVNRIAECLDSTHTLRPRGDNTEGEVIHRWSIDGADAKSIADIERTMPALGSRMTYTFVVRPHGLIEQALPLDVLGWHAKGYSRTWVGIVCVGDFRHHPMPPVQYDSLVDLLAMLSQRRGSINVRGHDQLDGGSADPNKECPGRLLSIPDLHESVKLWLRSQATNTLAQAGVVFRS